MPVQAPRRTLYGWVGQGIAVQDLTRGFRTRRASAAYLHDRAGSLRAMDRSLCVHSDARLRGGGLTMLTGIDVVHVRSRVHTH